MDEFDISFYRCLEPRKLDRGRLRAQQIRPFSTFRTDDLNVDVASRLQQPFAMTTAGIIPAGPTAATLEAPQLGSLTRRLLGVWLTNS